MIDRDRRNRFLFKSVIITTILIILNSWIVVGVISDPIVEEEIVGHFSLPYPDVESFIFIITILVLEFFLFILLFFLEVGVEIFDLWKYLSVTVLGLLTIAIISMFVYSSFFTKLLLLSSFVYATVICWYFWKVYEAKEEELARNTFFGFCGLSLVILILSLLHTIGSLPGIEGLEFIGFGATTSGPNLDWIISSFLSFSFERITSEGSTFVVLLAFLLISLGLYLSQSYASIYYLQGRSRSTPWIYLTILFFSLTLITALNSVNQILIPVDLMVLVIAILGVTTVILSHYAYRLSNKHPFYIFFLIISVPNVICVFILKFIHIEDFTIINLIIQGSFLISVMRVIRKTK